MTDCRCLTLALACLACLACAAPPPSMGGAGGAAVGSGGVSGTGGASPGTGGAVATGGNTGGLILGTGGPFPFPQNKKPPFCALTSVANASSSAQVAYNSWKGTFVTSSGAGSGLRVRRPGNQDDTVSEGIAYGMLAAVYMSDKVTFDGLLTYAKAHRDMKGLMDWKITAGGTTAPDGAGSASDGDVDLAWALIMASNQWSQINYLNDAKIMIDAIRTYSIAGDGMLKPGDGWGGTPLTNPSYFAPSYFRVFAVVSGDPNWSGAILDRNYTILNNVSGTVGLVPDWTNSQYAVNQDLMGHDSGTYGYDASRTPWRIAMDYCWNGEARAQAYLMKVGAFFNGVGVANIVDGYSLTGSPKGSGNRNMSFIGPAGVAAMAGFPSLLDGAFMFGVTNTSNDYFKDSLRVISMLVMSGNFSDFTKP